MTGVTLVVIALQVGLSAFPDVRIQPVGGNYARLLEMDEAARVYLAGADPEVAIGLFWPLIVQSQPPFRPCQSRAVLEQTARKWVREGYRRPEIVTLRVSWDVPSAQHWRVDVLPEGDVVFTGRIPAATKAIWRRLGYELTRYCVGR